jgi:hypothetical protein
MNQNSAKVDWHALKYIPTKAGSHGSLARQKTPNPAPERPPRQSRRNPEDGPGQAEKVHAPLGATLLSMVAAGFILAEVLRSSIPAFL